MPYGFVISSYAGSTIFCKYAMVKHSIETFMLVVSPKQNPFIS